MPKLTINHLPDELLVEIFDLNRDLRDNKQNYQHMWSADWFKLIHVCKRWRAVVFASSSRLDLCFLLTPRNGGHMKTIMSRHFPPLPIIINFPYKYTAKDMGRVVAALKRPDRIRGIAFTGSTGTDVLNKLFKVALPSLESLELCCNGQPKFSTAFLKRSNMKLRTLKLSGITLPSISRLLLSAPALTCLSLEIFGINTSVGPSSVMSLLSHLQGLPCLLSLDLKINSYSDPDIDYLAQPKEVVQLLKLTSFSYYGRSAYFNILATWFASPSLQKVYIETYDKPLPNLPHLHRFIDDIGEQYHTARVVLDIDRSDFIFSLFSRSSVSDRPSPCFRFCSSFFPESMMQTGSAFLEKITGIQELYVSTGDGSENIIPWRGFFLQFPSIKVLRLKGTTQQRSLVAATLLQEHEESDCALLPALEKIEVSESSRELYDAQRVSELAVFEPFMSARQQGGSPVIIFWSRRGF